MLTDVKSGFNNVFKAVLKAVAKAKTVTSLLIIPSVLAQVDDMLLDNA
jgi:hypothetical protein